MTLINKYSFDQIEPIGAISGLISILFYLSAGLLPLPDAIGRLLAFAFPLFMIVGFMGLYTFLKKQHDTPSLGIAYIFGIIGASIGCTFLVVQQANFIWHSTAIEAAKTEGAKDLLIAAFNGANRVQLGMDVAWDIFILLSIFFFGLNIARSLSFNKLFGWFGSFMAILTLTFNLYTFPDPPSGSLIDLGPFMSIWMFIMYIWFSVILFKKKVQVNDN